MIDCIERGTAIEAVSEVYYETPSINLSAEKFEAAINSIPAADIDRPTKSQFKRMAAQMDYAPVVHGRWEWFDEDTWTPLTGYEREWGWRCSCCGEELPDDHDDPDDSPTFRFCSNCGAKMDGNDGE